MHNRVIFLDIDGVLNSSSKPESLDPEVIRLLREVVERHRAEIVISSTWRILPSWLGVIRNRIAQAGWENPPIIDRTPTSPDFRNRGEEIQAWLNDHPTESFIILDDDTDMLVSQLPNFVQCNSRTGLTQVEVTAIDEIWSQEKVTQH